jgi:tetratricopeptide (TPR) repeat protein
MSKDKNKAQPAKPPAAKTPVVKPVPVKVPPLFRRIDWLVLAVVFGVMWAAYLLTLAPEVTLEDSGELCTASFYAGIPHPPGYPFWAIYSWLWTVIVPFGNVAWRVEVGESFAEAMACGLVGLMVSRGSSMLIEGIEELKAMNRKWENLICIVTGIVAGLLLGFDGFMWKESVVINRISIFDVPWLMVVALCLLRWIYAPHQRRFLYIGMFFFGVCATIHQTMLVAAMGIEVCIAIGLPRLGRDLFLGNSIIYVMGCVALATNSFHALNALAPMFKAIFHMVGIGSIAACFWLSLKTKNIGTEWKSVLFMGLLWVVGASFYFYEPISGMTCPPMQWGYPRTVEGFFHALTRGQYESASPTDIFADPHRFMMQLGLLLDGLGGSFSWVCLFIALLPFLFIFKMQNRERSWIIGLTAIYFCVGILLTMIMNTSPDRQQAEESKVFFCASHAVVAIMIGYGLALLSAYMATHYLKFRRWGLLGGAMAVLLAIYCLVDAAGKLYFGPAGGFNPEHTFLTGIISGCWLALLVFGYVQLRRWIKSFNDATFDNLFLWGVPAALVISAIVMRLNYPEYTYSLLVDARDFIIDFAHSPFQILHTELPHYVTKAFETNQYGLPVFANLILVATSIIFIAALLAYRQRGPVVILLLMFTAMPVWSGLSHWYKSEQRNHWFGYWFGHDMFTPPFIAPDGKFSYDAKLRAEAMKGTNADLVYPEMARDSIVFGGTDPGRFCPTYMIFCESFIPHNCQPKQDQHFDRRDCYLITQNALADGTYLDYLRSQYFRSQQHDPPFFREFVKLLGEKNPLVRSLSDIAYYVLDVPFTKLGAKVEARRRAEGVYPPNEIYIPSPQDSQDCFQSYTEDVAKRQAAGQLRPGETVNVEGGRVQVSGQVAVMMINGLLCKVIFDKNPTNEFYIEESFPLDWMYPYETPFGDIMKINRNPLPSIPPEVLKRDHEFWSKYSERLIGNWITYDTTPQEIADFSQKLYVGNNYAGFKGDRKFIRDDGGQKAFSKLRSSIAGVYAWRLGRDCPPEYQPKNETERQALIKEADFAFKQAFAFCPYSPEAVYRYVNFLLQFNRLDDALIVAQTCIKLDPYNDQVQTLINQLQDFKKQSAARGQIQEQLQKLQTEAVAHPTNFQNILALGSLYSQMQDTNRAADLFRQAAGMFGKVLDDPNLNPENVKAMAQIAAAVGDYAKLETTLQKLTVLLPGQPEPRYDLAALQAILGKNDDALKNLRAAIDMSSKRLLTNSAARNLITEARSDPRFNAIRNLPEFQKLVPAN